MQQIEDIYELSPTQIPLTISQRRFFQFDNPKPHHYNNALLREVVRPLHPDYLEQALRHVLAHHDGFRQVFRRNHAGWQGTITTYAKVPLSYVDISALPAGKRSAFIEIAAAHWQQSFRLSEGPNLRVVLFHCGPDQPQRLLVVMHHLLTDAISTNIFLGDLKTAYMQVSGGEPMRLPQQTTALKTWTERIVEHTLSGALCPEIPYWLAEGRRDVLRVPVLQGGDCRQSALAGLGVQRAHP